MTVVTALLDRTSELGIASTHTRGGKSSCSFLYTKHCNACILSGPGPWEEYWSAICVSSGKIVVNHRVYASLGAISNSNTKAEDSPVRSRQSQQERNRGWMFGPYSAICLWGRSMTSQARKYAHWLWVDTPWSASITYSGVRWGCASVLY